MDILSRPAEEFVNDPDIESAWVMKAIKHMEIHFNILCSVDPKLLRLTKYDEEIFAEFRKDFPDTCITKIDVEEMKGPQGKEKWREFCQKFEHVPDFNFGTILRINSDGDYSDENTVFVPRIQFYAVEIARNKEGCNDKIRVNFRKEDKEEPERTDYIGYISTIRECLSAEFATNCSVKKENGSTGRGDLCVFVQNNLKEINSDSLNQMCERPNYGAWRIKSCKVQGLSRLIITLDHNQLFGSILPSLHDKVHEKLPNIKCALILAMENESMEEATALRTTYLCEMLTKILVSNRYCVHVSQGQRTSCEGVKEIPMMCKENSEERTDEAAQNEAFEKLLKFCKTKTGRTYYCMQQVKDKSPVISNIPISQDVLVKHEDSFTEAFKMAVFYEHVVKERMDECNTPDVVYHIASQKKTHLCHQAAILWNAISNQNVKQICILHNVVNVPQNVKPTYDDIFSYKLKLVADAMCHKYGKKIIDDPTWKTRMETLAQTCLKAEILSVASTTPVWIHNDSKLGCFMQYNCARMSNILVQYENALQTGKISTPSVVDYSLLTKEEEWQLFWNYIMPFSQLIKDMAEPSEKVFQIHKVCKMLHCLSHDFSQYYGKVKILMNIPHLEAVMHSRMSLLRGLQHVFKSSLQFLDLQCLPEM